jgi:low affinity Fe/Cu permease
VRWREYSLFGKRRATKIEENFYQMAESATTKAFRKFSIKVSRITGSPLAFVSALGLIVGWLPTGHYFQWSEKHSFFINNITTVVTFLNGFVLQASQNRDSRAMQLKLDEIIRSSGDARNKVIALEEKADEVVDELQEEFKQLRDEE